MREVFASLVYILRESSPYLILGFALAGVFHVLLQRYPRITAALSGPGKRPIFLAALIGAPMPLCSCSVVPAALALRRQGASKAATASFLVSVPETDIVSLLLTLSLIGPFMAIYRPIAAVTSAIVVGFAIRFIEQRERARVQVKAAPPGATTVVTDSCCCEAEPAHETAHTALPRPWWIRALHYGFVEIFDDIVPQLALGIVIAALVAVALPELSPQLVRGHTFLSYLVMFAVGVPAYVCAAASTPIAAGLIAGGVSPGAALVFLLAGPATNAGSLVVLRSELGNRVLATYVATIAVTSVAMGALLDAVMGPTHVNAMAHVHEHGGNSITATVLMYVFLLWTILSFHRSRLVPRMRDGLSRLAARSPAR